VDGSRPDKASRAGPCCLALTNGSRNCLPRFPIPRSWPVAAFRPSEGIRLDLRCEFGNVLCVGTGSVVPKFQVPDPRPVGPRYLDPSRDGQVFHDHFREAAILVKSPRASHGRHWTASGRMSSVYVLIWAARSRSSELWGPERMIPPVGPSAGAK